MAPHCPYSNINENVQILIAHCKTLYLIVSDSCGGVGGGRISQCPPVNKITITIINIIIEPTSLLLPTTNHGLLVLLNPFHHSAICHWPT